MFSLTSPVTVRLPLVSVKGFAFIGRLRPVRRRSEVLPSDSEGRLHVSSLIGCPFGGS